jgi:hypothetical protein
MYSFRLRFRISDAVKLGLEQYDHTLSRNGNLMIQLRAHGRDKSKTIKDSRQLVVVGHGYASEEEAQNAGEVTTDQLIVAFARLRFPADFGGRAAKGSVTLAGQQWIEKQTGVRCLTDVHGLQVYKTEPDPRFLGVNADATIVKSREMTVEVLKEAFAIEPVFNERRRLAFELFSASSFVRYVDARFMLLMMAVETLIEKDLRPAEEVQLIDKLIRCVEKTTIANKESIANALRGLREESIGAAGRRLAGNLKELYNDQLPGDFFIRCYRLRSRLVHGQTPRPNFDEVNAISAPLETFAADLISYPEFQSKRGTPLE